MAIAERVQIPTGVPGLDQVLRGGLPPDHLYLIQGPSGSGKTTLALQFLLEGVRQGERSLYIGTAETGAEIRAMARSHGWDLTGIEMRHQGDPDRTRGPEQTMLLPAEAQLPRVMEEIKAFVDEVGPDRMVVDSLTEIRLLSREDDWLRDQIQALRDHMSCRQCTVLVTDLFAEEQFVLRSAVHGVIELEQEAMPYGPDHRRLRVVKLRGVPHGTGSNDFMIETGGIRVFPRLVAADHRRRQRLETVSSGLAELDTLLGGGFDRGTATLLMGPTGTGKSTLMTQYLVAAARRGEKSVMYVFDERVETLFHRAAGLGLELERHVDDGLITLRQIDPVELTPGQFSQAVVDAADHGAGMIAIDSLNGYAYAMPEEQLLGLHLHELVSYLSQRGVTTFMVMTEHGLLSGQAGPFDISYIADTVILLRPFEHRGVVRTAVAVHKRRAGPHERAIREFDLSRGRVLIGRPIEEFTGVISGNLQYLGEALERPRNGQ